jgi:hypothetical protein
VCARQRFPLKVESLVEKIDGGVSVARFPEKRCDFVEETGGLEWILGVSDEFILGEFDDCLKGRGERLWQRMTSLLLLLLLLLLMLVC